jgi:hypothetical protein
MTTTNGDSPFAGPFLIEEGPEGRTLVVTEPWNDHVAAAMAGPAAPFHT